MTNDSEQRHNRFPLIGILIGLVIGAILAIYFSIAGAAGADTYLVAIAFMIPAAAFIGWFLVNRDNPTRTNVEADESIVEEFTAIDMSADEETLAKSIHLKSRMTHSSAESFRSTVRPTVQDGRSASQFHNSAATDQDDAASA